MVCQRCIEAVQEELNKLNISNHSIQLGSVHLDHPISDSKRNEIRDQLKARGFELLEDRNSQYIDRIKSLLVDIIHNPEITIHVTYSSYLEKEIGKDYSSLSTLFSSIEGLTIERFIILLKIEKVKELLIYDEMTLSQISYQLEYSSVQHLSSQFKKIIGMTPSEFKKQQQPSRNHIDRVAK